MEFAGKKRQNSEIPLILAQIKATISTNNKTEVVILAASEGLDGDEYWELLALALDQKAAVEHLYRQAARHTHPDKSTHPLAAEAFKRLNAQFTLFQNSSKN